MNVRVFLLFAAMAAFGILWSSDGRYQSDQVALARIQLAQSQYVVTVATFDRAQQKSTVPMAVASPTPTTVANGPSAAQLCGIVAAESARMLVGSISADNSGDDRIVPQAILGRLAITWLCGIDPGNGVTALSDQVDLVRIRVEERICLLRFRGRQAAYFACRRIANYFREQLSDTPRPARTPWIVIGGTPIKESQAPAAAGRQTR
jgi:hypothetical protein